MDIRPPSVAVAMSGGLDSSMAAALLVERGHACIGLMMRLWSERRPGESTRNKCCSAASVDVARAVADALDMPFYLINAEQPFKQAVVDPFIADYMEGRTPNPCLNCNRRIRFTYLLEYAARLGVPYLATGHHARTERAETGQVRLRRAADRRKDQSYVLSVLDQARLRKALFPVGDYQKAELREMARQRALPAAEKPESMDLCFVADDDYRRFLDDWAPAAPRDGPVLTTAGEELGRHAGLYRFTIGQRRGLNLPNVAGQPMYVVAKEPARNALVVGTKDELVARGQRFALANANWNQGRPPLEREDLACQIRYNGTAHPCRVEAEAAAAVTVTLAEPQAGVAPGQAAVVYAGEYCLGGGTIVL